MPFRGRLNIEGRDTIIVVCCDKEKMNIVARVKNGQAMDMLSNRLTETAALSMLQA